jgi:FkbM family methyltransferase
MLRTLLYKFRELLTRFYDPVVPLAIGSCTIKAPLSHPLRRILQELPQFGFNITRLATYIHRQYPDCPIIDIGANIGDTAAFINNYRDLPVLCIDGDANYFGLLQSNTRQFTNTRICRALVGETDEEKNKVLVREKGTAFLKENAQAVPFRSLENILEEFPGFKDTRLLKIDTDGYDASILRGSKNYLVARQPVLFFEYDPGLIQQQGENPFDIFGFLEQCGYEYVLVYQNVGDYLLSLRLSADKDKIKDLVNYYMGRHTALYADLCVFSKQEAALFESTRENELAFFAGLRKFRL